MTATGAPAPLSSSSDTECKRQHHRGREPWIVPDSPEREPEILTQLSHRGSSLLVLLDDARAEWVASIIPRLTLA